MGRTHRGKKSIPVLGSMVGTVMIVLLGATAADAAPLSGTGKKNTPTSGIYTLPTRMCGPFFLIPLNMPGRTDGERAEMTFLFDTGASIPSVDPESLVRLTGRRAKAGERVDLVDARTGPLTFRRMAAVARTLDPLARTLGVTFDGILGYTAFRDFLLTVDYPSRHIRLSRGNLPPPDGREVFDAQGPDNRPFVDISQGARTHRVLIDTGSPFTFALRPHGRMSWRTAPVPVKALMHLRRLEMRKAGRLADTLRIGEHRIKDPLIYLTTNDTELMGGEALKHFTVTFDQKYRRVRLRRAEHSPLEMPSLSDTGAILRPHAKGLQVVTVLKGTPAQEAGLRAGDLIVTANGEPPVKGGCPTADNRSKLSEITYEVQRGRNVVSITMRPAVLVE